MTNSIVVQRRTILFGALASAVILTAHAAIPAHAVRRDDVAPDALVQSVLTGLIESIRTDPSLRRGDFGKLQGLVDDKVAPHVDFEKMTRLSVGPGWRRATPQQRKALIREFRAYALHTYSGALSRAADERLKVWPVRWRPDETDVTVRTELVPSNGDPIPLNYRLEKTPAGWKMYDMTIFGVSLAENFRNSFEGVLRQSEVDDLITALAERNKELAAGNRP